MPIIRRNKVASGPAGLATCRPIAAPPYGAAPSADRYANLVVRQRVRTSVAPQVPPSNDTDPEPDPVPAPSSGPGPAPAPAGATYEVGHGKPPKDTQFQKGVSGNPKGRPKGAKGLNTLVIKVLGEKVAVRTAEGTLRMSKMEAMIHKLAEQGFGGNLRAISIALNRYASSVPDDVARPLDAANDQVNLDEHDIAILAALRASMRDDGDES
jgi:hypothetical protein